MAGSFLPTKVYLLMLTEHINKINISKKCFIRLRFFYFQEPITNISNLIIIFLKGFTGDAIQYFGCDDH